MNELVECELAFHAEREEKKMNNENFFPPSVYLHSRASDRKRENETFSFLLTLPSATKFQLSILEINSTVNG